MLLKYRDRAIRRASSFSFEIRSYESKHFDFPHEEGIIPSIICNLWIRNHQKRKKKKKIIESKFILPCKLDLILHAPIFARNRPLDIRERRIYSDTESYCTPQRILYFVSNKFSFSISPLPPPSFVKGTPCNQAMPLLSTLVTRGNR